MAETVYNAYKAGLARGEQDWVNDNHAAILLTGAVTIDPDHATLAAVIAANTEASDGSYARVALASEAVAQDDANNRANLDAATIDFGALDNETPTAVVIVQDNGGADSGDIPISIHDSGFGVASNGAGYTITVPNDVVRIT